MMVFINEVNNYMFRPIVTIFRLLLFYKKNVIYMSKHSGDVEISSSFYVLQISLFSGTSRGSMNGGV